MSDKKVVKTVRFKEEEIKLIEDFLIENPAIDFSTLVRLAVGKFVNSPSLNKTTYTNFKSSQSQQESYGTN